MESPLSTRSALLLALRQGPGSGLRLIERLARSTAGVVRPAEGSVYPTLARLREEGLVRRLGPSSEKRRGRARVDYELTAAGAAASHDVKRLLRGLTGPAVPTRREPSALLQERLRESMDLSELVYRWRDRMQSGRRAHP